MRILSLILLLSACRSGDPQSLTGTWAGTATPNSGAFLQGGADVTADLTESDAGAYFGTITFDTDTDTTTFDVGAEEPGNRIQLFGKDVADTIELSLLLDQPSDDRIEGTWTMFEIDCPTTTTAECSGSGSIGLDRR